MIIDIYHAADTQSLAALVSATSTRTTHDNKRPPLSPNVEIYDNYSCSSRGETE